MGNEQNQKDLEISDLKDKLSRREQEVLTLKKALQSQISEVKSGFVNKVGKLEDKNNSLE
jgi:hypothetical protein